MQVCPWLLWGDPLHYNFTVPITSSLLFTCVLIAHVFCISCNIIKLISFFHDLILFTHASNNRKKKLFYFLGHCYGSVNYQPVVHPSSQAYGGGSSTCIDYPGSDGDSTHSDLYRSIVVIAGVSCLSFSVSRFALHEN
jgi:hypothetical protein